MGFIVNAYPLAIFIKQTSNNFQSIVYSQHCITPVRLYNISLKNNFGECLNTKNKFKVENFIGLLKKSANHPSPLQERFLKIFIGILMLNKSIFSIFSLALMVYEEIKFECKLLHGEIAS